MGRVPGYLPLGKGDAGSIYWTRPEVDDNHLVGRHLEMDEFPLPCRPRPLKRPRWATRDPECHLIWDDAVHACFMTMPAYRELCPRKRTMVLT